MNKLSPEPNVSDVMKIVETLERELQELDRIGAHIAAAHLDAAIQQLRNRQPTAN